MASGARERAGVPDPLIVIAVACLLVIGIVMVMSSSSVTSHLQHGDPYWYAKRQALWAAVGLVAMAVCSRLDYRLLRPMALPLLLLSLLLLALVLVVGAEVGGSRRWISLGLFNFQPSEVAKLAVVTYLSAYAARHREGLQRFWTGLLPPLGVVGLTAGLILLEPDFGTAAAMVGTAFVILFAAGARIAHLGFLAMSALPAAGVLIWMEPYRMRRLMAFIDPWADKMDSGWNVIQSLLAIGSGGLFGLGLGEGRQKYLYVPEQHTDFIFSILSEELGFIGASLVLGLFFILGWRGFRTALRAPDPFGCILAVGLTTMIVCQALLNIGVVTGSLPVTGMTLPLISFGGSSLVVSLVAVGLLLSISRRGREPGVGWYDDLAGAGYGPGAGRVDLRRERSRRGGTRRLGPVFR